jgi:hypothetical protein
MYQQRHHQTFNLLENLRKQFRGPPFKHAFFGDFADKANPVDCKESSNVCKIRCIWNYINLILTHPVLHITFASIVAPMLLYPFRHDIRKALPIVIHKRILHATLFT